MALHVIVGKGPVGTTTAEELVARGHEVRVLSRSGGRPPTTVEHRQVDATDADALTDAARGAAALYNAVNPAYHRWADRLAAGRGGAAHRGRAHRRRPRDHVEPLRLRPARPAR